MAQILAGDRKQLVSENIERAERYSLNLARITGVLLLLASIGGTTLGLLGALSGTWGDPNAEDHRDLDSFAGHQSPTCTWREDVARLSRGCRWHLFTTCEF